MSNMNQQTPVAAGPRSPEEIKAAEAKDKVTKEGPPEVKNTGGAHNFRVTPFEHDGLTGVWLEIKGKEEKRRPLIGAYEKDGYLTIGVHKDAKNANGSQAFDFAIVFTPVGAVIQSVKNGEVCCSDLHNLIKRFDMTLDKPVAGTEVPIPPDATKIVV